MPALQRAACCVQALPYKLEHFIGAAPIRSGAVEVHCCGTVDVAASQDMHTANMCREPIRSQHKC